MSVKYKRIELPIQWYVNDLNFVLDEVLIWKFEQF